ncbi:MAG: hypothetical protein BM562_18505 [Alphaproteobacteria bacterium MedPE-SWcel]|nr:MAG: hypothetical protein BM562_18505 [Alphaproteobacteria bacterium MedPE-SWcel]
MAHLTHTSPKPAPIRPHIYIAPSRTKLYLPRGSRNHAPKSWTRDYPGPIKAEWTTVARSKGFDLIRRIRDKSHVVLRCHTCSALTAQKLYTLRTAQPACAGCRHRNIVAIAQKAGLEFLGYDPEYHKLGIYRAPCGHTVRRQFGQIERIADGRCKLRCETCHSGKEAEEAADRGWRLQGSDPEGNPNYRIYRHGCGHRQRVARTNMRSGRFQCAACGEGWATAPSNIYAIRLELPSGLRVVKLGFSRDPRINRTSTRTSGDDLSRLQAALQVVAFLLVDDPVYAPLFERLEEEIRHEEDTLANGAQARARALLARTGAGLKTKSAQGGMPHRSANHPDHSEPGQARAP